jgi:hypothetical protein
MLVKTYKCLFIYFHIKLVILDRIIVHLNTLNPRLSGGGLTGLGLNRGFFFFKFICCLSDKLVLRRLRTDICKKENAAKKQTTILNYFKC